jgi:hypothetical protein
MYPQREMTRGHLILVAGHAVPHRFEDLDSDDSWYLKHFQHGDGACYVEHVRRGVERAAADPDALLLFAGGQTDREAGPRSEGQGYWLIAEHANWFGHSQVRDRAGTEEFSLDSFQNLLFGICRFREFTGGYPHRITAMGWIFKGPRFDLHREAIRFPAHAYSYEGVNNPDDLERAERFEAERRRLFHIDPYGSGEEPRRKRELRNPFRRHHGYHASCPELTGLLSHEGPELFDGRLPWTT